MSIDRKIHKPLVRHPLSLKVNYDLYGHCVLCHDYLLFEEVINGKVTLRFSPRKTETEFLLDDGSRMRVSMCIECKNKLKKSDEKKDNEICHQGVGNRS